MNSQTIAALVFGLVTLCAFISLVNMSAPPQVTAYAYAQGFVHLRRYRLRRKLAVLGWFAGWCGLLWLAVRACF